MENTSYIVTSVVVFTVVIMALVTILMLAAKKLVPQGFAKLSINEGSREIDVKPGASLLTALSNEQIFLPSACGGGGTCAMCKCKVLEGGGELLPTEAGQVTKAEAKEGVRLACQLKVKEDMVLDIEPEILDIKKYECTVRSNENVATFIKELVVELPKGEKSTSRQAVTFKLTCLPIKVSNIKALKLAPSIAMIGNSLTCSI